MRKALLVLVVAAGLFASALPANAAAVEWKDPEGDATGLGLVTSTPAPSDDAFDIMKVAVSTTGPTFNYVITMKKLAPATPNFSTGYYFRLAFTWEGGNYWFIVGENAADGAKTFALQSTAAGSTALPCKDCTGTIDRKANAVIVKAPVASFAAAMKAANKEAPPVGPGTQLTKLNVLAQRRAVAATLTADDSIAKEEVVFTF